MKPFVDFYQAWHFLENHRIFQLEETSLFHQCLEIDVVKVNPEAEEISDLEAENTTTRVWLECGPWESPDQLSEEERKNFPFGISSHDIELDCGASTFEEVVIKLANLVLRKYGA